MTVEEAMRFPSGYRAYDRHTRDPPPAPDVEAPGSPSKRRSDRASCRMPAECRPNVGQKLINRWCEVRMSSGERALPGAVDDKSALGRRIPTEDPPLFRAGGGGALVEG